MSSELSRAITKIGGNSASVAVWMNSIPGSPAWSNIPAIQRQPDMRRQCCVLQAPRILGWKASFPTVDQVGVSNRCRNLCHEHPGEGTTVNGDSTLSTVS